MAQTQKKKKEKLRHRIIIRNVSFSRDVVKEIMENEIGKVSIVSWEIEDTINFEGMVSGGGKMPQRIIIVMVTYTKR